MTKLYFGPEEERSAVGASFHGQLLLASARGLLGLALRVGNAQDDHGDHDQADQELRVQAHLVIV